MSNCKQMLMGGGKPQTPKMRDERIDSVKYWLIVLVIAGHVFDRPQFSSIQSCETMWKWIFMFHMPLFVFFSGYFSNKKNKKDLWSSVWKLLEPLIVFQVAVRLFAIIFKGYATFNEILTPWWVLWYLLSLIYWRLLLQIIPDKILKNTKLILIISIIISILAGFLPFNRFLSVQRTLAFLPFFFLGYCLKEKKLFLPHQYKKYCFVFLIVSFVLPIIFIHFLGDIHHADPYYNINGLLSRIIVFCLSIPMSLAFINTCPNYKWCAQQGKYTLQYYIYHALAIPIFMMLVDKYNLPVSFIAATGYTIILTIGLKIILRFKIFRKLITPLSYFSDKIRGCIN